MAMSNSMPIPKKIHDVRNKHYLTVEICIRSLLLAAFLFLEYAEPFRRKVHPEEIWLYRNPRTDSYVPTYMLWPIIVIVPFIVIFVSNVIGKYRGDGIQAVLGISLAFGINGFVTNSAKIIVGRPRPDYFFRCFPNGEGDITSTCTGNKDDIIEGLKSFPSGHSSFAFASMMYCSLYLCGKLQVFTPFGRGDSWRLLVSFSPMFLALLIALSRTCDYHHHWQDVLVGSLLGCAISWICYFQYYPQLANLKCPIPLPNIPDDLTEEQMKKMENLESVKWI